MYIKNEKLFIIDFQFKFDKYTISIEFASFYFGLDLWLITKIKHHLILNLKRFLIIDNSII